MMKIRYRDYTPTMKILYWGTIIFVLINIICLVLTLNPGIIPGGQFFIGLIVSMLLACFFLIVLTIKILKMKNADK